MLSFRQYLIEQLNIHPHNVGHETDDVGTTTHTYEDRERGVMTKLMTHPSRPGEAYFGFMVRGSDGEYTDKPPAEGEKAPSGRLESALGHAADFAKNNKIHTITFQTADQKLNPTEEDTRQGNLNTRLFSNKWGSYQPEVSKNTKLVKVDEHPLSHLYPPLP